MYLTDSPLVFDAHPHNDPAGNGYCFDCGLPRNHEEAVHTDGDLNALTERDDPNAVPLSL